MRMKLLKVVVVLLLSGSGDARPQKTGESVAPPRTEASHDEWRPRPIIVPRNTREDSRYTWNSGSSTFPYTNHYHSTSKAPIDRRAEVSSNRSRGTSDLSHSQTSLDHKDSRASLNAGASRNYQRFEKPTRSKQSIEIPDQRVPTTLNVHTIDNDKRNRSRNGSFSRLRKIPGIVLANSAISDRNHADSIVEGSSRRSSLDRRIIPLSGTRVTRFRGASTVTSFTTVSSRDPSKFDDLASRRSDEIVLNNSRSSVTSLVHNSREELFTGRREPYSSDFDRESAKVASTVEFDHVAAIKRITGALTRENTRQDDEDDDDRSFVSSENAIRDWNVKHANRTKHRRPSHGNGQSSKKTPNKRPSNKIVASKNDSSTVDSHLKNWPNGPIQNADDFHHYDAYTTLEGDPGGQVTVERPVWSKNASTGQFVPVSSPNLQEIVHWLKIPAFMTNGSHVVASDPANSPVNVAFDPVYQDLEPNRPSKPNGVQTLKPGFVYPIYFHPDHTTDNKPSGWPGQGSWRNKTVHNPQTQVSQNTVVHLIHADTRKPNRTIVGDKVSGIQKKPVVYGSATSPSSSSSYSSSSGSSSYLSSPLLTQLSPTTTTSKPGPNVHIGFTSYEENNKVPDLQKPQTPMVTYDRRCPTILINSYTRINNTIQSKEGCTDLNIIINSQVFNTNTYKTTVSPLSDSNQQTYGQPDSTSNYQPVPVYRPSSPALYAPQSDYHAPPKDPQIQNPQSVDVSNVEVLQNTQISISSSGGANDATFNEDSPEVEASLADDDSPEDSPGSSAVTGPEIGQTGDSSGVNSVIRPETAAASPGSGSSNPSSNPLAGLAGSSPSTSLAEDDDDDDDYDFTPGGIMESIASVFTYFTFVNPLHYGFFSIAAAPFTAMAAGVLGIATFLYPLFFPSSFGFSRANNDAVNGFWTNLEEVVRQSMHKYGGLHEWKSKRKKRKR